MMKTFLHHTASNLYIQSPDKWTQDPELALDFKFPDRAIKFADTWELNEVEVVLVFDRPPRVMTVPMNKSKGA